MIGNREVELQAAVERGLENLAAHAASAAHFQRPVVVAINQFGTDHADELAAILPGVAE